MTGSESDTATRESRTTLMSGSGAGAARGASARVIARRVSAASGRAAARPPPFESRDAGDEQHADDEQNDAQLWHSRACRQPVAMRTASSTSTDTRREHARLGHGDADQLRGQLHGGLVVRDEDELHALGHLLARCRRSGRRCARRAARPLRPAGRTARDSGRRSRTPAPPRSAPSRRPTAGGCVLLRLPGGRAMTATPRFENVFADELEVGVTAAEQAREFVLRGRR